MQQELQDLNHPIKDYRDLLELKYKSKPFASMEDFERINWATGLLVRIARITGWVLPKMDDQLDVMVDLFQKKLILSYPTFNPDEIEYAFLTQGTTIKDWGKEMNISLIDEVMIPFADKRFEASRVEEQKKTKPKMIERKEDISDEGMDKFWEETELLVKKGNYPVELIPPGLYEWMDKNGNILCEKDLKMEYIERATICRHGMIVKAYEKNPYSIETKNTLTEFNKMRETKLYSSDEHDRIKELAKKMIVFDMMKAKIEKIKI